MIKKYNLDDEKENIEDWRNEHGKPDFTYLQSLVTDGSVEAIEKIKSIATDLDVNFNSSTSVEELIDMIRQATRQNEDTDPSMTS
jgi:hypothetical protein